MSGNPDFDTYRLSEDHEAIREAVRAVAEDKIAPWAAAVDEDARYPVEAHDALVASDFFAPTFGGVRRCRRRRARHVHRHRGGRAGMREQLAHPRRQQAPDRCRYVAANEDVRERYLTPLAAGETTFSYGLSERAGSDAASMRCQAVRDGDDWVITGQKSWITNAGSAVLHRSWRSP